MVSERDDCGNSGQTNKKVLIDTRTILFHLLSWYSLVKAGQ